MRNVILFSAAFLIAPIDANALSCKSSVVFLQYASCQHFTNGWIYKEKRSPACNAETYKTCTKQWSVSIDPFYWGSHINEQKPRAAAGEVNCRAQYQNGRDPWGVPVVTRAYREAVKAVNVKYHHASDKSWDAVMFSQISRAKVQWNITGSLGSEFPRNKNWYFTSCYLGADFTWDQPVNGPECGVEIYSLCRDPRHGRDYEITKPNPRCGTLDGLMWVESGPDDWLQENGRSICLTEDQMSDQIPAPKLSALQANYDLLLQSKVKSELTSKGLLDREQVPRFIATPNVALAKLQVQFEIFSLSHTLDPKSDLALSAKAEIARLIEASYSNATAFEQLVDSFDAKRDAQALAAIAAAAPEQVADLARARAGSYIRMTDGKYYLLFPNGVELSDQGLLNAEDDVLGARNDLTAYRIAEAAVRTGLTRLRQNSRRQFDLMDLRIRIYRNDLSFDELTGELATFTGKQAADVAANLEQWNQTKDQLRKAASNIVKANIDALETRAEAMRKQLAAIVSAAHSRSRDTRVALLDGYLALNRLDAATFAASIQSVASKLKYADSVGGAFASVRLLANTARNELEVLDRVRKLFEENQSAAKSIVGQLGDIAADSNVSDRFAVILNSAIAKFEGGPGAEESLTIPIQALLETNLNQFQHALRGVPELGQIQ
ncbi:MAG: hypothetical protein E5V48_07435 [Mesorhizobium sp.]|nr:MAG: hypothetical protein E5V48_07435 [Mesorhizobium sp.]